MKRPRSRLFYGSLTVVHLFKRFWHGFCDSTQHNLTKPLAMHMNRQVPGWVGGGGRGQAVSSFLMVIIISCWGNLHRELGLEVIEVNASDTRNKADGQATVKAGIAGKLANSIKELTTNTAIGMGSDGRPKRVRLQFTRTAVRIQFVCKHLCKTQSVILCTS